MVEILKLQAGNTFFFSLTDISIVKIIFCVKREIGLGIMYPKIK